MNCSIHRKVLPFVFCCWSFFTWGQLNSLTAGSDFGNVDYKVHVSVGQIFGSYKEAKPLVQEGVLAVLIELMDQVALIPISERLHISPNPFDDELTIDFLSNFWEDVHVDIYSLTGALEQSVTMQNPNVIIKLGFLPQGVYLLHLRMAGQPDYVQKIVKYN